MAFKPKVLTSDEKEAIMEQEEINYTKELDNAVSVVENEFNIKGKGFVVEGYKVNKSGNKIISFNNEKFYLTVTIYPS